jgi:hypothetical protein
MSRGRPPKKACIEAVSCARLQGAILDSPGIVGIHADCILFLRQQVVFIRVKRGRSYIRSPQELVVLFSSEIKSLRTVPLTPAVSRQVWVLLPWGTWQYFSIFDDRIVEIQPGPTGDTGAGGNTAGIPGQKDPVPVQSGRE